MATPTYRSVWLCSRNDAIGNVIVMVAALAVWARRRRGPIFQAFKRDDALASRRETYIA